MPLAAVLYNGGMSIGGVISFVFADLIILPILVIYRKYYGTKMMLVLLGSFSATMVLGGYAVELIFGELGLVPDHGQAKMMTESITWNYTTWLSIASLVLTAVMLVRLLRTGGRQMMSMTGCDPEDTSGPEASSSPEVSSGDGHPQPSGRVDDRAYLSDHSQQHASTHQPARRVAL